MPGVRPILLLAVLSVISSPIHAATFVVDTTSDTVDATPGDGVAEDGSGDTSLRAAIQEANALAGDDIITLPAGTYTLSIAGQLEEASATGDLDVTSNLTINGANSSTTIVSANNLDRVFHILSGGSLILNDVTVRDGAPTEFDGNQFPAGGGLYNDASTLELNRCIVRNNEATFGAGGIGAVAFAADMTPKSVTTTIRDSTITVNQTALASITFDAGGIGNGATSFNGADAIAIMTIENSVITLNSAIEIGNGIVNSAAGAGASATITITDTTMDDNDGVFDSAGGGGLANFGSGDATATATVTRCTITNHSAPAGGIWNFASEGTAILTVINSTLSGNEVWGGDVTAAGGIMNHAANGVTSLALATVTHSTITNNSQVDPFPEARGIVAGSGGIGNRVSEGGTATFTIENSIVHGNSEFFGYPDAAGTFDADANNLIGDTSGSSGFSGSDLIGMNPLLASLANNGGPTLTHAIPVNSPARNKGDNTGAPSTDQRGLARIFGGAIDIGAFELQGLDPVYVEFNFGGTELGTLANPFKKVADAVTAAANNATINIKPGSTSETLSISQSVTLQTTGGTVTIGASGARSTSPPEPEDSGFVSRSLRAMSAKP